MTESRFAEVLVDEVFQSPVPLSSASSVFDYRVPKELVGRVDIGSRVRVPLGQRTAAGFVVGMPTHPAVSPDRLRPLLCVLDQEPLFGPAEVRLAEWLADRYMATRVHALRLMLPPGLRSGTAGVKTQRVLLPLERRMDEAEKDLARAQRQLNAFRVACSAPHLLTRQELARLAGCSTSTVDALVGKGYLRVVSQRARRRPEYGAAATMDQAPVPELNASQRAAVEELVRALQAGRPATFLLDGVTGSGKTEVYLRLLEAATEQGGQAIMLVPEIALTPQTVARLAARLPSRIAVLHSGLSPGQRYDEWDRLRRGEASLAVGARSAVFAPCRHLRVIIVDEEHENTYKNEEIPRYHTREVALRRAKESGALVVLGSATPSIESYHAAREGEYGLLRLPERVEARSLPLIESVDMRSELAAGNRSIFSRRLQGAVRDRLDAGEQVILFLNRRGYASFVLCRECGHVVRCPRCDVTLTYHAADARLRCHYCDYGRSVPQRCPGCGGDRIRHFGTGTQKVEAAARAAFPDARIARLDLDSARGRGAHREAYEAFRQGRVDILVGTQMIAKGWDIPSVTLVGVVTADTALNLPDFRSGERTFQLITQVAGRAGRGDKRGQVIVQTYDPEHPAIRFAVAADMAGYYDIELEARFQAMLPPFASLVRMVIAGREEELVRMWAGDLAGRLRTEREGEFVLTGPAPAPLTRVREDYRWHILLKTRQLGPLLDFLRAVLGRIKPGGRDPQISVDVDPQSLL